MSIYAYKMEWMKTVLGACGHYFNKNVPAFNEFGHNEHYEGRVVGYY